MSPDAVKHDSQESDPMVIEGGSFSWGKDEPTVLHDVNVRDESESDQSKRLYINDVCNGRGWEDEKGLPTREKMKFESTLQGACQQNFWASRHPLVR